MKPLRLIVLGNVGGVPYPGTAWQAMQYAVGLRRLGHEVYYFETASTWPFDPIRCSWVCDSDYTLPYLAQVVEHFGFGDRWAYRRSYSDKAWFGLKGPDAEELLAHADAVLSITGSTPIAEEGLKAGRLVYVCTDPVVHEARYANGDPEVRALVEEHDDVLTFGENIGTSRCPLPALPRLRGRTRQPVLLDQWQAGRPLRKEFTTIGNWKQSGHDSEFRGEKYYWSKHLEYLKFMDLPRRRSEPLELATSMVQLSPDEIGLLTQNGWRLTDAQNFTLCSYRDYIQASSGEFTVAKDANVRLCTGWFSDRSACYLAAGRPVITQDTGFSSVLPTGEGLFAFKTMEDILTAFDKIDCDYARHSKAASEIAQEYFRAETVLEKLLCDLGL